MSNALPHADRLLQHAGWLRRLALELVREEAAADDVVQETWLRALERPPADDGRLAGWLARVARNVVFERWRRQGARRRRERRAARPESIDSSDSVVERAEIHQRLVAAVMAVEEPFRTVLLLRWFDELSSVEIARRTGVAEGTVRTRLWRGMERLRARLDAEHGDSRRAWALVLVPLARAAPAATAATGAAVVGALAMSAAGKVAIAASALFLVGLGAWSVLSREHEAPHGRGLEAPTLVADVGPPTLEGAPDREVPSVVSRTPTRGKTRIGGIVWTTERTPIPGARVLATLRDGAGRRVRDLGAGQTALDGRFQIAIDVDDGAVLRATHELAVTASAPGLVPAEAVPTIPARSLDSARGVEVEIVLVPGRWVHGVVLDRHGDPLGADIPVVLWARGLTHDQVVGRGVTDVGGGYRLVFRNEGQHHLGTEAQGFGVGRSGPLHLDLSSDFEAPPIRLVGPGVLEGIVRFPDGTLAAHAPVGYGQRETFDGDDAGVEAGVARTDVRGRFQIEGLSPGEYNVWAGGATEGQRRQVTGDRDIELVLPLRHVRAHVVDERGRPVAGARVWIRWLHPNPDDVDDPRNEDGSSGEPTDADGFVDAWYDAGDRVHFAVATEGLETTEVEAPGGDEWSREVVLVAREVPEAGRLRVRLNAPDGRPLPKARLDVEKPLSGIPEVYDRRVARDEEVSVPAGTWRVVVGEDGPPTGFLLPEAVLVTVRPGAKEDVEVRARAGGRLRLTLRGVTAEVWDAADPSVLVTPLDGGRPTRGYGFWMEQDGGWRTGGLVPGLPGVLMAPLVPGRHRVRIEAKGFVPIESEVAVPSLGFGDLTVEPQPLPSPEGR